MPRGAFGSGMSPVVIATAFGGPEVLSVTDQPAPDPGPGEARITVRAAGVNPVDYKMYSGNMGADPDQLPLRPGFEAAGVITQTGPGAAGPGGPLAAGDEVIAYRVAGAYAAELTVPGSALVPKPASLDWAQASGLMLAGVTAWHALAAAGVQAGDTVLIHGGNGGVGVMGIQLGAARGATVIATGRPENHEFLRGLGAIPVAYGDGLAGRVRAAATGGVDAALDFTGSDEAVDVSLELVADRARIVSIAAWHRGGDGITLIGGGPGADPGTELRNAARPQLARLAQDGALRVVVSATFPLAEAAAAHREIMGGHVRGKIALIP